MMLEVSGLREPIYDRLFRWKDLLSRNEHMPIVHAPFDETPYSGVLSC